MINPSTISFLNKLKSHNERPWFQDHKAEYLQAKENFDAFIQQLLLSLAREDTDFGKLSVKDCVFRIYRDIRFSKDKTPYKTHFAAGISKKGRKVHFPGIYLHVEPENTYVGGGIWHPDREILSKIRQEIDYNLEDFEEILQMPSFQNMFGALSATDTLKRPPKGYDKDNPAIAYLKLKSFIAQKKIEMEKVTSLTFQEEILKVYRALKPLLDFLELALDG